MVQINFKKKEITCKVVYCGLPAAGKSTSIEVVQKTAAPERSTALIETRVNDADVVRFCSYTPDMLLAQMKINFMLIALHGAVWYGSSKKTLLQGADGIVFVADSQATLAENENELATLEDDLQDAAHLKLEKTPHVFQWNKRDLRSGSTKKLDVLNKYNAPAFDTIATKGDGVIPALAALISRMHDRMAGEYGLR